MQCITAHLYNVALHNTVMRKQILAFAGIILLMTAACSDSERPEPSLIDTLPLINAPESRGPRLEVGPHDTITLSWMEPDNGGTALRFSTYSDDRWTVPRTAVVIEDMFVNWADLPSVVPLGGSHWFAHWLQKSGPATYAYDVVVSQSHDGGSTWSAPSSPHDDGTQSEHGFVSSFVDDGDTSNDGSVGLIWLDGRKTLNESTGNPLDNGMTLRAAFIDPDGQLHGQQIVDDLVCDCCQTDVAVADSGPVAVFRDRSPDEIRDIYVSRFVDGQWEEPLPLANDRWQIAACPVNGPAIVADGDRVAVTWFSAANNHPVVRVALSDDGGRTFGPPIEIAAENTLGRVGIEALDDRFAVSWLAEENGAASVHIRTVSYETAAGPILTVTQSATLYTVPQMARAGDFLVFAWTVNEDEISRIESARIPIGALLE